MHPLENPQSTADSAAPSAARGAAEGAASTPIVVVGSLNMDLVVSVARHPKPGETILGAGFQTFPGGKGANQAVAAARLGGQVRMVGCVGGDTFGAELRQSVAAEGVDVSWVKVADQHASGMAFITVDQAGENTIVVAPGANAMVCAADVRAAEDAFAGAGLLLVQLECPLEAVEQAITLAHKHGLKVALNPAPARELDPRLLASVDVLLPNASELALLSGMQGLSGGIAILRGMGVPHLVVTLGSAGAVVVSGGQQIDLLPHPVRAVDATAAGDAFAGAFAVALSEGKSILEAAGWGNAAGALAVTQPGAQPSLPTRAALLELLKSTSEAALQRLRAQRKPARARRPM